MTNRAPTPINYIASKANVYFALVRVDVVDVVVDDVVVVDVVVVACLRFCCCCVLKYIRV